MIETIVPSAVVLMALYWVLKPIWDAYKGACTDALTKIGSYLYIGMDVYKGLSEGAAKTNGATSYNHKSLEVPGKPLITNAQFKSLTERIKNGDLDAAKKASEVFSFEPKQQSIINDLIKQPA